MTSRGGLFRGGEFPRLLILLGLMVIGWPMAMFHAFSQKDAAPPPISPTLAGNSPLPPPDEMIELSGVEDWEPPNPRDNPGYRLLFDRTRSATPETLDRVARRDVVFSQIYQRPGRYRGLPIHLSMNARRIVLQDQVSKEITLKGEFYEAWAFSKDSQSFPYVLAFEDAPADLPVGNDLNARITFDGYFFKMIRYQDGKGTRRFAPLLIGRVSFRAPAGAVSASSTGFDLSWKTIVYTVLIVASLYLAVRLAMLFRRQFYPVSRPNFVVSTPVDQIEPADLSRWLEGGQAREIEILDPSGRPIADHAIGANLTANGMENLEKKADPIAPVEIGI